ncbi:class I SAM-dependent methyltransferase [Candidatus Saccharibacteria bacterium]|nr:class I SAM-dependent methyltransferase [Candidatus Saccharibacteria bacterium]
MRDVRQVRTESGQTFEVRRVSVGDIGNPEERAVVHAHLQELNELIVDNSEWPTPNFSKGISNPASDIFYQSHLSGTSMQYWRDNHMPGAEALFPLQRLDDAGRLFPGGFVDSHAMDIFTYAIDSIAIRARGSIHNSLLLIKASETEGQILHAIALGAGAGVPNIDATVHVRDQLRKTIRWREYDLSYKSLQTSVELFKEAGIPDDDVVAIRGDLKKAYGLPTESADIIDMLGLWEYLSHERCVVALRSLYKILKPGGIMVVSNMLPDRPQLELNQKVISWPGVQLRSVDELIDIAVEAGIDPSCITITKSDDAVYAVMEIRKP